MSGGCSVWRCRDVAGCPVITLQPSTSRPPGKPRRRWRQTMSQPQAQLDPKIAELLSRISGAHSTPNTAPAPSNPPPPRDPRLAVPSSQAPPTAPNPPPRPDPRAITTLPAARRYIAKYLSTSTSTLSRISHLISQQHSLERAWHQGRVDLIRSIDARPEAAKGLNEILSGLSVPTRIQGHGEEEREKELREYDRKVMAKAVDMCKKMERELGMLGVPGFVGVELEGGMESKKEVLRLLEDLAGEE